jgi:hypothetical protein
MGESPGKACAGSFAIRADLGSLLNLDERTYLGMVANFGTIAEFKELSCWCHFEDSTQELPRIGSPTAFAVSTLAWRSTRLLCANSGAFTTPLAALFAHAPAVQKRWLSKPVVLHASTLLQSGLAGNSANTVKEVRANAVKEYDYPDSAQKLRLTFGDLVIQIVADYDRKSLTLTPVARTRNTSRTEH